MNKPIKYIVSGNYNEYQAYVRSKPRDKYYYKYVSGTERLCGLSSIEGYYIGTYMDRPDIDEIKVRIAMIKSIQSKKTGYRALKDPANIEMLRKELYAEIDKFNSGLMGGVNNEV